MAREYKQLPFYVQKLDSDQGVVDAIVAVMGNVDHQRDIIDNGAFTKTIKERGGKIRVLDNHNTGSVKDVVGKPILFHELSRDGLPQELLQEHPDATGGLFASIQFLMDTPEGRGVFSRIKSGAINEYSIGYDALDTMIDTARDNEGNDIKVRRLKTIRLWEISPVIFAANDATVTVGAKSTADIEEEPKAKEPEKEEDENDKDEKDPTEGKPYGIFSEDGEHCIFKIDEDGNAVGDTLGCHPTRAEAADQIRALQASETDDKESDTDDDKNPPKKPKHDDDKDEKTVSGKTTFPLAGREVAWDGNKAETRVREFTGSENEPSTSYKDGFFWYDSEIADTFGAYKLGFTDIIDGKRMAIPRGIFAVAASLQGARGQTPDIPESDIDSIKSKVASYYKKMTDAFGDEIQPPWEKSLHIENLIKQFLSKEMTDYGPQQRFGDVLQGSVHKVFNSIADKYYIGGYVNREQRILLSNAIGKALDVLSTSISDDVSQIPVYFCDDDDYHGVMSDSKESESKAGRVLARRNENRLVNALMVMIEILEDAGIDIPGFSNDEDVDEEMSDEKADTLENQAVSDKIENAPEKAAQQQDETGPIESPISDRDKLLQSINISVLELELLED